MDRLDCLNGLEPLDPFDPLGHLGLLAWKSLSLYGAITKGLLNNNMYVTQP
jgi:hypothetical protein